MKKALSKKMICLSLVIFTILLMNHLNGGIFTKAYAASDNELVIQTWGGKVFEAVKEAYIDPFSKETGIKVIPVTAGGDLLGKVTAQIKSGNVEWDIISGFDYPIINNAASKGLLEEIDYSIVTNTKDLIPGAVTKWGLGQDPEVQVITYNRNKFPGDNYPKSWVDFFDVDKFPGPRTIPNWGVPHQVLAAALLADGVPKEKLIPLDFDRAFKKMDKIKPFVKVWYTGGDQSMQAMLREEAVIGMLTDGRAKGAQEIGAPINIEWNQGLAYIGYWSVVKNAPHKKAAMQFLNFTLRPDREAIWTKIVKYTGVNTKLLDHLPPEEVKNQCIYPDNWNRLVIFPSEAQSDWVTAHNDEILEKWNTWLSK